MSGGIEPADLWKLTLRSAALSSSFPET